MATYVSSCSYENRKAKAADYICLSPQERLSIMVWMLAKSVAYISLFDATTVEGINEAVVGFINESPETLESMESSLVAEVAAAFFPQITLSEAKSESAQFLCVDPKILETAKPILMCRLMQYFLNE